MRAIVQRVLQSRVEVNKQTVSQIKQGLLVYVSVDNNDSISDARYLAEKVVNLRIFSDSEGKMNRSVLDSGGAILMVSNFTLHGDCRKGRRPSFDGACEPKLAQELYEKVIELIAEQGVTVEKGVFGEHMQISSVNDGPANFLLDSKKS